MGLFRSDDEERAGGAGLEAELERVAAMPLPELARELLERAWGPGGPGDVDGETGLELNEIQGVLGLEPDPFSSGDATTIAIAEIAEEAVQELQNQGLVVLRIGGSDYVRAEYRPTRAGRAAIGAG